MKTNKVCQRSIWRTVCTESDKKDPVLLSRLEAIDMRVRVTFQKGNRVRYRFCEGAEVFEDEIQEFIKTHTPWKRGECFGILIPEGQS